MYCHDQLKDRSALKTWEMNHTTVITVSKSLWRLYNEKHNLYVSYFFFSKFGIFGSTRRKIGENDELRGGERILR